MPVDDTSSPPDDVLSDSSDSPLVSSPDSPVLNTDGLVKSVQSVPDPPRHRIPALLSDSLSAASRRSSSPLSAKPTPSLPSGKRYGRHHGPEEEIGGCVPEAHRERKEKTCS